MHSFQKNLPEHWNEWIRQYSKEKSEGKYESLGANDFLHVVTINFVDDSKAIFNGAFVAEDKEKEEIAIFTEHCGYHIFNSHGIESILDENNQKLEPAATGQRR